MCVLAIHHSSNPGHKVHGTTAAYSTERIPHQHLSKVSFPGLERTMGKIKWIMSVTEAREMMRSFVSANILCGENRWAQKIWVQPLQKPPGHPAEPLNTMAPTQQCVFTAQMNWTRQSDLHRNENIERKSREYKSVNTKFTTVTARQANTATTDQFNYSQLLLPMATLPLCCISSHHGNQQPAEKTDDHPFVPHWRRRPDIHLSLFSIGWMGKTGLRWMTVIRQK